MKLDRKVDAGVVDSNGAKTTSSFSIATTTHMFNILSSGLYADKIKAVLREVSCNAMDAHIMAGKPARSIEVKLPNELDPTFYVKDWGPGLDEDEIRQLYTTYGWSAKQDSDDVTGAFGLGSKSPFAYTHSFTIQSSKNGRTWTMTAHQDEDGKPAITKVAETEAAEDWPAGVLVTFAVEPSDFAEFERKARSVFRWFSVKPIIKGASLELDEPNYDFRWHNYGFSKEGRTVSVVMGNVAYPVDVGILRDKVTLSEAASGLLERTLTVWLPIGTVMMTPSRESLEYTKKTVEALRVELERAAETLYQAVVGSLREPASSELEMHRRVYHLRESFPHGVKRALDKAFATAEDDVRAIAEATWAKYINGYVQLEQWVGEGASPMPPYLLGADNKPVYDQATAKLLRDTSWKASGARVYAIVTSKKSRRSSTKASKREIVGGRYANTIEESQKLTFNIDRIPPLYVLDSSVGISALKLHAESTSKLDDGGEGIAALVVIGSGRDGLEKAKAYAQRIVAQTIPFAGSSAALVSEAHASEIAEIRSSRKRYRSRTREEWLEQKVCEMSLVTARGTDVVETTTTLESFEEANDERYYVLKYRTGGVKFSSGGYDLEISGYKLGHYVRDGVFSRLCELAGLDTESVLVIENKAQFKALKLEENGYKELFSTVATAIRGDDEKRQLLTRLTAQPAPSLTNYGYSGVRQRVGIVGTLTAQKRGDTLLWQRLSERYPHHPVVQAAIVYDGLLDNQGNAIDKWQPLREFFDNVSYARAAFGVGATDTSQVYALFDDAHKALPHWEVLNLDKLAAMATTDLESVSTLLDVIFLLGGNLAHAAGLTHEKKAA